MDLANSIKLKSTTVMKWIKHVKEICQLVDGSSGFNKVEFFSSKAIAKETIAYGEPLHLSKFYTLGALSGPCEENDVDA